ncbi:MAG: glutaredoxin [Spirochaetae bacterium HGW-Spirochaetae-1]|jgi:glutaredoxin-like protein|nr:MAG: glutaredoxin [Spirochaetae bacterium HGW-Spirochaetae-1]
MALFDQKIQDQLKQVLGQMKERVNLVFVTQEFECGSCSDTRQFVEEITGLSDKLSLTVYDFQKDGDKVKSYGVDKIPAIVLLYADNKDRGIRFYGLPGGYEINSFMQSILEVSGHGEELPVGIKDRIGKIKKDIHIQVFVSLGCPYCPQAVSTAHRLALENDKITADMVEASTFPHLANKYNVSGVPKIIINETHELTGAHPVAGFLDEIEKI